MPFSKETPKSKSPPVYFVQYEDDIATEDDSSDTNSSLIHSHSQRKSKGLQRRDRYRQSISSGAFLNWTRWGVLVALQLLILTGMALLCRTLEENWAERDIELRGKNIETGDDINGLYKTSKNYLLQSE
jgi:hypothetical protein